MGLLDGLRNLAMSPLRMVTGPMGSTSGAVPLTADSAATATALSSASTALRSPLSQEGSMFGAGGSPQAKSAAQAAMLSYPTTGAGVWK